MFVDFGVVYLGVFSVFVDVISVKFIVLGGVGNKSCIEYIEWMSVLYVKFFFGVVDEFVFVFFVLAKFYVFVCDVLFCIRYEFGGRYVVVVIGVSVFIIFVYGIGC